MVKDDVAARLNIPAVSIARALPLSPAQRDLYLDWLIRPESTVYSIAVSETLGPTVDPTLWEHAVQETLAGEEIARTTVCQLDNEILQIVREGAVIFFSFCDLTSEGEDSFLLDRFVANNCKIQFDLRRGPLLRNFLVDSGRSGYIAIVAMPHLRLHGGSAKPLFERLGDTSQWLSAQA